MVRITPTTVPKSATDLRENLSLMRTFTKYVHVDIDDGIFTKEFSWPYTASGVSEDFSFVSGEDLEIGVHLMVQDSEHVGVQFAKAGVCTIIGHIESFADLKNVQSVVASWREAGATEIGIAILLGTGIAQLETVIDNFDFVHVLSVATIGEQGAPFDERAIERVKELHAQYPELSISVDGGVNETNITSLIQAGADRFAIGSAIMHTSNPALAYTQLKNIAESALQ